LKNIYFILSFPSRSGILPSHLLNKGGRVQILGLKPFTPIVCAAEQLAYVLQSMNSKTIISIDLDRDEFVDALRMTPINSRVSAIGL